jgi:hypothetical protein
MKGNLLVKHTAPARVIPNSNLTRDGTIFLKRLGVVGEALPRTVRFQLYTSFLIAIS